MSRPLRIEYPNAWYHVMNRGAGYRNIFCNDNHRILFLDLLSQISKMFRVEIHGFCLMDNHYHLLIHTSASNLQRAMRHLSGVYTQRHNRLETTDGALNEKSRTICGHILLPENGRPAIKRNCKTVWFQSLRWRIGFDR